MKIVLLLAATLSLAACAAPMDRCSSTAKPDECRAWSGAGGDIDDYLVGGMAGYLLANRGGQTVVVRDASYRGAYAPLHHQLTSENVQLRQKVERQRVELRKQQEANTRKSAIIRASSFSPSSSARTSSSWTYRTSYRSSSFRSGRK